MQTVLYLLIFFAGAASRRWRGALVSGAVVALGYIVLIGVLTWNKVGIAYLAGYLSAFALILLGCALLGQACRRIVLWIVARRSARTGGGPIGP